MLRAPDHVAHGRRLLGLAARYRHQERWMKAALQQLQDRLEQWHRDTFVHRIESAPDADSMVERGREMQSEYDELAAQLVHVRMAIAGADEELAGHEGPDWQAQSRLGA